MKSRVVPPRASTMLESLRGLGYSLPSALADVIDNSITAGARHVQLQFSWAGPGSTITVLDDGVGMDDAALETAMRLGGKGPLDVRDSHDLGRFGLGLKTASFSQCRRLTVASRRGSSRCCLRWDLDIIASSPDGGWHLLDGPAEDSIHLPALLDKVDSGTLVAWQLLDRLVTPGFGEREFLDVIDTVERHLAMVFHRYLDGETPRLRLSINGRDISAWDPFLINNPATWSSPVATFRDGGGRVSVQCHVLPHRDRLDASEIEDAAGPDGWTAQQGFYVYRNERLLVAGSWLGLGRGRSWTKEEAHRLARLRIDIPNTADADWKIDIRKSVARPPVTLREALTRLAEEARDRARRVFAHRGQVHRRTDGARLIEAWRAEHRPDGVRYRIDPDHPAIRGVLDAAGPLKSQIKAMLAVIEQTIPVQRIWLDTADAKETPRTRFAGEPPDAVRDVLQVVYRNLRNVRLLSPAAAREHLKRMDPFANFPELVDSLPDEPVSRDAS